LSPLFAQGVKVESEFGHAARDAHFLLDPQWTFVNHGAFGSPLAIAFDAAVRPSLIYD
jgi:hypothetical protein